MNSILKEEFEGLFRLQEATTGFKKTETQEKVLTILRKRKTLEGILEGLVNLPNLKGFSVAYKSRSNYQKFLKVDFEAEDKADFEVETLDFGLDLDLEERKNFFNKGQPLQECKDIDFNEYPLLFVIKQYIPYQEVTDLKKVPSPDLITVSHPISGIQDPFDSKLNIKLVDAISTEISITDPNIRVFLEKGSGLRLNSESYFRSKKDKWLQDIGSSNADSSIHTALKGVYNNVKKSDYKVFKYNQADWYKQIDESLVEGKDWLTNRGLKYLKSKEVNKEDFLKALKSLKFKNLDEKISSWEIDWGEGEKVFPQLKDFITSVQNDPSQEEGLQTLLILNTLGGKFPEVYYINFTSRNFKDYDLAFLVKEKGSSKFKTYFISSKSLSSNNSFSFMQTVIKLKKANEPTLQAKVENSKSFEKEGLLGTAYSNLGSGSSPKTILKDIDLAKAPLGKDLVLSIYDNLAPFFFKEVWDHPENLKGNLNTQITNIVRRFFLENSTLELETKDKNAGPYENILVKSLIWSGLEKYLVQYSQPEIPEEGFGVLLKHNNKESFQVVAFQKPEEIKSLTTGCLSGGGAQNGQPVKLVRDATRSLELDFSGEISPEEKLLNLKSFSSAQTKEFLEFLKSHLKGNPSLLSELQTKVADSPTYSEKTSKTGKTSVKQTSVKDLALDYKNPEITNIQKEFLKFKRDRGNAGN